jgi:hypothetical protein
MHPITSPGRVIWTVSGVVSTLALATVIACYGVPIRVTGGAFNANTGGGSLAARDMTASTATAITEGGPASLTFATAPDKVQVSSNGGPVTLDVPGGPYALTALSDGGQESVTIATSPAASRTITADSGDGALVIEPAGISG